MNEKNGKFTVFVPQLSLFAEGESLQRAYDVLMSEKRAYYSRLEAVDSLHLIPELQTSSHFWKRLDLQKVFVERSISFFFTTAFWVLLVLVATNQISRALTKSVDKLQTALMPVASEKSEERFQRFQEKMKVISPYVKEVKKVFKDQDE